MFNIPSKCPYVHLGAMYAACGQQTQFDRSYQILHGHHFSISPTEAVLRSASIGEKEGLDYKRKVVAEGFGSVVQELGEQDVPQSLLQALLCGAMHSRAAYGYAMAAGHLSSLLNFALLQTVGPFGFPHMRVPHQSATFCLNLHSHFSALLGTCAVFEVKCASLPLSVVLSSLIFCELATY